MKHILPFLLLLFSLNSAIAQQVDVNVHARVDTSQKDVRDIVELWSKYLNAQPDSTYDNPFWNTAEKKLYANFDLSKDFIYQFPSKQLLNYYKPTILSIEKSDDDYIIRTLFSASNVDGDYRKYNPWCITKLYAVKENGEWKLKNALPYITKNWKRKTVGKITFIYSTQHKFNLELAKKANEYCNRIAKDFELPEWEAFDYYITDNADEMGQLLNFDYFYASHTTGVGMYENRMLFAGFGSEWYPHEFVHLVVPFANRHQLIDEGFATWQGGAMEKSFEERAKILANEFTKNDTLTFTDILNKSWGWQYAAFYTSGAIICKLAYDKGGIAAIKKLLAIPPDDAQLIDSICTILDVPKNDFEKYWRLEMGRRTRDN